MPSTYKTEHLGLNRWIGTDKPKRTDFNEDNDLLDASVFGHLTDTAAHITQQERALWNAPCVTGSYVGDNASAKPIALAFKPRAVVVSIVSESPMGFSLTGELFIRSGFATSYGGTKGVEITQTGFTVRNVTTTPPDGESPKLNMTGYTYTYFAFK